VTLLDGKRYELFDWEIEPERVTGKRRMAKMTMNRDGTVDEEEFLEPTSFHLSDVANLDVEKVDRRSLLVVGAIAGGVAGVFAGMAAIRGGVGCGGGRIPVDPGPIGDK
jgi:hypothetical protein